MANQPDSFGAALAQFAWGLFNIATLVMLFIWLIRHW